MFFFLIFVVSMLFFFVLLTNNIIIWWSIFVMMDLLFIFLCKKMSNYVIILNYFIIQETLGLVFLFFSGIMIQFIIVMTKMGLAPFHYWIFSIIGGLESWVLLWFLTFQKLPFFGVLLLIFFDEVIVLIIFGFVICYVQLLLLKDFKFMMSISSTESFNWILLGFVFSFINSFVLFIYYFLMSCFMVPFFNNKMSNESEWLTFLIFMNLPLGAAFFVKIFTLSQVMISMNFFFVFILLLMFVNFFSLSVWLIMKSLKEVSFLGMNSGVYFIISSSIFLIVL